jgi:hypothetical protein
MIEPTECCIPKRNKINEIIDALNPLLNIEIQEDPFGNLLNVQYSENNVMITIPAGGGGLPDGYSEELFDVVLADNTAGERYFLTRSA